MLVLGRKINYIVSAGYMKVEDACIYRSVIYSIVHCAEPIGLNFQLIKGMANLVDIFLLGSCDQHTHTPYKSVTL